MSKSKRIPATIRNMVWNFYIGKEIKKGLCFCCNSEDISSANFQCGHIISKKNGGNETIENLRPICGLCNKSMGAQNMEIFMDNYELKKNDNWNGIENSMEINRLIQSNKQCYYCKKTFSQVSSLNRHLKDSCKIKKQKDEEKKNLEEMKIMKAKIAMLEAENNKYKQNIQINNNNFILEAEKNKYKQNIQINNNNFILSFGSEDTSHITDEIYKEIFNREFNYITALIEKIHLDKNKPENHNIYISNTQTKYIFIYVGTQWKLMQRDEILQELIDVKSEILMQKFNKLVNELNESAIIKFQKFIYHQSDKKYINSIKNDLKLLLYNNRNIPIKTKIMMNDNNKAIYI